MSNLVMRDDKYGNPTVKIYGPSNVYDSAVIGSNVKIGAFTEIGSAIIEDNVIIGAQCFIPENIHIAESCWIGPGTKFANDLRPPSPDKSQWSYTFIERGVVIGMGCTILPGITIGEGAFIGAGSVVTKNVPPFEQWCGVPARKMETDNIRILKRA